MSDLANEHNKMILDGTKINWHLERVNAWIWLLQEHAIIPVVFAMQCFKKMTEKLLTKK